MSSAHTKPLIVFEYGCSYLVECMQLQMLFILFMYATWDIYSNIDEI
jgi:hypothetical protein